MTALIAAASASWLLTLPWEIPATRWMLGAFLFATVCAVAALLIESALRTIGRPARLVWAVALCVAAGWPLVAPLLLHADPMAAVPTAALVGDAPLEAVSATEELSALAVVAAAVTARLDTALLVGWLLASTVLLLQTGRAVVTLRRIRLRARTLQLDGTPVLIDAQVGPAVLGVVHPAIVFPEWVLELDAPLRRLVLRHEREHCRVRDPLLVWLSVIVTTLLPWNAALWWMARRLRLAMEIDCDARTLAGSTDRTRYARLLLLIAQQRMSARFAPMLANTPSLLTRRIRAMHSSPARHAPLRAVLTACLAVVAMGTACSSRIASNLTSPSPVTTRSVTTSGSVDTPPETVAATPAATGTSSTDADAVMAPGSTGPQYPAALRAAGTTGRVLAQFIVGADGRADTTSLIILRATAPEFATAVRTALPTMRFMPARKAGVAVRQLHQQPFLFALNAEGAASTVKTATASDIAAGRAIARANGTPFFDFQVDAPVVMRAGSVGPTYPSKLREAKVMGTVLVQVVIDETGRPDMSTFKVLRSDHGLFSESVMAAMLTIQWEPAKIDGQAVRQLVQQPFQFDIPDSK